MSPAARAWLRAGLLCVAIVVADQVAKAVIRHDLVTGEVVNVLGPLKLTLAHNTGVAFGIAGGAGIRLIVLPLVALGVVAYLFARNPTRPWMWVAAGLLGGGAIGNLADRVRSDSVTDYIELPSWPPFNLADVAITCGVIVLVVIYLREGSPETADDG